MTPAEPYVHANMEVAMPTFTMAFKCESPGTGEEAIRQEMVADLAAEALFGESSDLYLKLYEEGLIDGSVGGGFETVDGCALLTCGGDSRNASQFPHNVLIARYITFFTADTRRISPLSIGQKIHLLIYLSCGFRVKALFTV